MLPILEIDHRGDGIDHAIPTLDDPLKFADATMRCFQFRFEFSDASCQRGIAIGQFNAHEKPRLRCQWISEFQG